MVLGQVTEHVQMGTILTLLVLTCQFSVFRPLGFPHNVTILFT